MNTTQKGDVSEYKFILYCLENDVAINKPIGNNLPYDFIIEYNNKLLKVQVKTAYKNKTVDGWTFNTRSCSKNYNEVTQHNYIGLVDYFAVVNPKFAKIIFVPVDKATTGCMNILYSDTKVCCNQHYYKDYLLF